MADIRINALATTAASTASDDFVAVDGSANGTRKLNAYSPTFGGNLTVSGTGTSSVAGSLSVNTVAGGNPTVTSTLQLTSPAVTETGAGGLEFKADVSNNGYGFRTLPVFNGVSSYDLYTQSRSNSASWTTRMSLTNSGNLLIGTTTDSANGKLQLATHTTSAGGIGFGTDVSLYRQDANTLVVQPTGSSKKVLFYGDSTVSGLFNSLSSYEAIYFDPSTHSIKLATNGFTALTLDTSQNATFAGKVGIGVSPSSWELNLQQSATNSAVRIISPTALGLNDSSIYIAWASGSKALIAASYESTGSYRPLVLSAGGVDSLTLDTSGNSTFAGNIKTAAPSGGTAATWRLGTVASVSPTSPNRTIEVEIGGTTYYIHAKTTNN